MDVDIKSYPSAHFPLGVKNDGYDTKGLNSCAMGVGGINFHDTE